MSVAPNTPVRRPPPFPLPRWVGGFDALLVCILLLGLPASFAFVPDTESIQSVREQQELFWTPRVLDLLAAGVAAVALAAPAMRRYGWHVGAQRALFWVLVARTGYALLELSLPAEGGTGGFLLLVSLPPLVAVTVAAGIAARAVRRV